LRHQSLFFTINFESFLTLGSFFFTVIVKLLLKDYLEDLGVIALPQNTNYVPLPRSVHDRGRVKLVCKTSSETGLEKQVVPMLRAELRCNGIESVVSKWRLAQRHRVETYRDVTDRRKHCGSHYVIMYPFFQATGRKMINCACSASLK
jgi:hypothetical protein